MLPILGIAGASMVSSCEQQQPYEPAPAEVDLFLIIITNLHCIQHHTITNQSPVM